MNELIICCLLSFAIGAIVTSVIWNIVMNKMFIKYYKEWRNIL